jgi:hypothetical protein
MDAIRLSKRTKLSFVDGHALVEFDDLENSTNRATQPFIPYEINNILGQNLRNSELLDECLAFMKRNSIPLDEESDTDSADAYNTDLAAQVGVGIVSSMFPVFVALFPGERGSDGFYGTQPIWSKRIAHAFLARDIRTFTELMFGQYRKDIVRMLMSKPHVQDITWTSLFANHMPIDWIITGLQKARFLPSASGALVVETQMDRLLSKLTQYEVRRLMTENTEESYDLIEASRIMSEIPDSHLSLPTKKDATSLHDHFTFISKGMTLEAEFDIPEVITAMDGQAFDGLSASVLRTAADYRLTGEVMNNCAGTAIYAVNAIDKKGFLVRFGDETEEFKYLLELQAGNQSQWYVRQLYGTSNTDVPEDDLSSINHFLQASIPEITLAKPKRIRRELRIGEIHE